MKCQVFYGSLCSVTVCTIYFILLYYFFRTVYLKISFLFRFSSFVPMECMEVI